MDEDGLSYVRLVPGKIAGSLQLADDVVADYDAGGGLLGIEFLSAAAAARQDEYVDLARRRDMTYELSSNA